LQQLSKQLGFEARAHGYGFRQCDFHSLDAGERRGQRLFQRGALCIEVSFGARALRQASGQVTDAGEWFADERKRVAESSVEKIAGRHAGYAEFLRALSVDDGA
jgi:hypothetical protein